MSYNLDNASQRVLPHVIEALQRLQENPDQLAHERDQRYDEPPPPYTESGETTQPPSPGLPIVAEDVVQVQVRLSDIRAKSTAICQFKSQAKREEKRFYHQQSHERRGRRQTLPYDEATDPEANAENNVRARWVEQGIWGEEWGPAWPQGHRPDGIAGTRLSKSDGPFHGSSFNPTTSNFLPGSRWGHEQGNTPSPSPSPSPPPTPASSRSLFTKPSRPRKPPKQPRPRFQTAFFLPDGTEVLRRPKPTVRDPEASRPLPQFLYQISKEREWIRDETAYMTPGRLVDLDALAYQSVKETWIKDGIWSPKWHGDLPGSSWYHEEPESYGPLGPQDGASASTAPAPQPHEPTTEEPPQQSPLAHIGSLFDPAPTLARNDLPVPASVLEEISQIADTASNGVPERTIPPSGAEGGRRRRTRNTLAQETAPSENAPRRAQAPRRSRNTLVQETAPSENAPRRSRNTLVQETAAPENAPRRAQAPRRSRNTLVQETAPSENAPRQSRNTLVQETAAPENAPRPAQAPRRSLRGHTSAEPDGQNEAGPPPAEIRRTGRKRTRADGTRDNEQPAPPPKRPKTSGGGQGRALESATGEEPEHPAVAKKQGVRMAKAKKDEPRNEGPQREGPRRSARIANRQAQAAAAVVVTNAKQTQPTSSRPKRAAKKGSTITDDAQAVSAPKRGRKRRS